MREEKWGRRRGLRFYIKNFWWIEFVRNPSEFFYFALHEKLGGFYSRANFNFRRISDKYTIFVGNSLEYTIFLRNSSEIYSRRISDELRSGVLKHSKNKLIIAIDNILMIFRGYNLHNVWKHLKTHKLKIVWWITVNICLSV